MKTSLVNKDFYASRSEEITPLIDGIGNFAPTDLDLVYRLRAVDVRGLLDVDVYELPQRGKVNEGAEDERHETDDEYQGRVKGSLISAINRVKNGVFDAIYIEDENLQSVFASLSDWPRLEIVI